MQMKIILTGLLVFISISENVGAVLTSVDQGLKHIESFCSQMEEKIETSYTKLKKRISGLMLTTMETIDSRVSQAMDKIQGVKENCRVPAELSLENLERKIKEDFYDCSQSKINERTDSLYNESQELLQSISESYNTSVKMVMDCGQSKFRAMKELRLNDIGTCEFSTGLTIADKFIGVSSAVNRYLIEVVSFSYDLTNIVTTCFRDELVVSSVDAIVIQTEKCQQRFKNII